MPGLYYGSAVPTNPFRDSVQRTRLLAAWIFNARSYQLIIKPVAAVGLKAAPSVTIYSSLPGSSMRGDTNFVQSVQKGYINRKEK